jgi:hypothetical protein
MRVAFKQSDRVGCLPVSCGLWGVWAEMPSGLCWGPSSFEGPQNTTNMFSKHNTFTGTFGLGMKLYSI